jgi:hypothetical protein
MKSPEMKEIKRDYHLKSKNSLNRDDTRNIIYLSFKPIEAKLKKYHSFIKGCANEIFVIDHL